MEYRSPPLRRLGLAFMAVVANIVVPFAIYPIERNEIFPLLGFLILVDAYVAYLYLQETRAILDADKMELSRTYLINKIKPEIIEIRYGDICSIKRIRGKKGGPTYSIYYKWNGRDDKVTINSWEIDKLVEMAEDLSLKAKIPITNSWFF